MTKQKTMEITY